MPRQSRIDAPGALHHIMIRGIERKDIFCYWAVRELGLTATALAGKLGLTQSGVSRSVLRGKAVVEEMNLKIIE